jgi:prefoldin subunit 5
MIKSYIKETLARLTGDKDKVIAEKNFRKNTSAVEGQIARLKSDLVNAEDELDTAQESLKTAKYPTTLSVGGASYIQSVVSAKETVERKQQIVDQINESIKYYQALLAEFNTEVEG